jgi:hypothetical protein
MIEMWAINEYIGHFSNSRWFEVGSKLLDKWLSRHGGGG